MITAGPGVIIAGAASGLLVVLAALRLHTCGGGYALFAAWAAARGAVFLIEGSAPLVGGACFGLLCRWLARGRHNALWPVGGRECGASACSDVPGSVPGLAVVPLFRCWCLAT